MARSIGRDVERLKLVGRCVLDEFLAARIRLLCLRALLKLLALCRIEIGDGNNLDVRVRLVGKSGTEVAHALASDADANLLVGERLPLRSRELPGEVLVKALHNLFLLFLGDSRVSGDCEKRGTRADE